MHRRTVPKPRIEGMDAPCPGPSGAGPGACLEAASRRDRRSRPGGRRRECKMFVSMIAKHLFDDHTFDSITIL